MKGRALALAAATASVGVAGATLAATAVAARHPTPTPSHMMGTRILAHSSKYGRVIFTGQHRSVYIFARDHHASTCYGACATSWPPVLTHGRPEAGPGVNARLLGTVRRKDGTTQATYAGHPLYRFVKDTHAYQITCQNVSNFGAKWWVITPAGKPVR